MFYGLTKNVMKNLNQIHLIVCSIFAVGFSFSQCAPSAGMSPSNVVTDNSVGTLTFSSLSNSSASDNVYSSVSALALGDKSNYVVAKGFGFAIPANATICGITVTVEKKASGLLQNVHDFSAKIVRAGTVAGNNNAAAGAWPTSDATTVYGSSSDSWGLSWSPADINDSEFGFALSADLSGISVLPTASVDYISMVVSYSVPLPVGIVTFDAVSTGNVVEIKWATASETNNDFFSIEYSVDGSDWSSVGEEKGMGNSASLVEYTYTDRNTAHLNGYYRLKQTDFDGTSTFSKIVAVSSSYSVLDDMKMVWNETAGVLTVVCSEAIDDLYLSNALGQQLIGEISRLNDTTWNLSVNSEAMHQLTVLRVREKEGPWLSKKIQMH